MLLWEIYMSCDVPGLCSLFNKQWLVVVGVTWNSYLKHVGNMNYFTRDSLVHSYSPFFSFKDHHKHDLL